MPGVCPFPRKKKLTKAEAKRQAMNVNRYAYDGGAVRGYHCPAGGHWHIGHRPVGGRKRKQW